MPNNSTFFERIKKYFHLTFGWVDKHDRKDINSMSDIKESIKDKLKVGVKFKIKF